MGTLSFEKFVCGPLSNNVYLVHDSLTGGAVLIDASPGSFSAHGNFLKKFPHRLEALLITHGHWDHTAEASLFAKAYSIPVLIGDGDSDLLCNPSGAQIFPGLQILSCEPTRQLRHGESFSFLGRRWQAIAIAGHTPGGIAYFLSEEALLFSGDTLFRGTVGRSDLPGGDGKLLLNHIRSRLMPLDNGTAVLPGHGGATTIGRERAENPYLT
jgi:glyoxylase-like metal-dependent hydrolase (beta-lactamase superfamily II)